MRALLAAHGGAAPLLFAHQVDSAERVVRTDLVPMCWATAGPSRSLELRAAAGQYALAQAGVLTLTPNPNPNPDPTPTPTPTPDPIPNPNQVRTENAYQLVAYALASAAG